MKHLIKKIIIVILSLLTFVNLYSQNKFMQERFPDSSIFNQLQNSSKYENDNLFNVEIVSELPVENCSAISKCNDILYLGTDSLFIVATISDSFQLKIIGSCVVPSRITKIKVEGNFAYILCPFEGLRIIDISVPQNPFETNHYTPDPDTNYFSDFFIQDTIIYIADNFNGIRIVNISDIHNLLQIGSFTGESKIKYEGGNRVTALYVKDNYCYAGLIYQYNDGDVWSFLYTIDISNPYEPFEINNFELCEWIDCLTINDNFIYICDFYGGFYIYEISNLDQITIYISNIYGGLSYRYGGIVIKDNFAYIAKGEEGLRIIDISEKSAPKEVGYFQSRWYAAALDVFVDDTYVYLCFAYSNVYVLKFIKNLTAVDVDHNPLITKCRLKQNYPNPFNPETTIEYDIYQPGNVKLKIYNLSGQEIITLIDGFKSSGNYSLNWQPKGLPNGIYFYRLETGNHSRTRKLIFQK